METALSPTKKLLASRILERRSELESWIRNHVNQTPPPIYCSIDLRDAGHKIAPVDSNLYPAGFNNICPEDQRTSPKLIRAQIEHALGRHGLAPDQTRKVLVLPESNTGNPFYIENLYVLTQLLREAGLEVAIGWWGAGPDLNGSDLSGTQPPLSLHSESGKVLSASPIRIDEGGILSAGDFTPDWILLNNDFSSGYPRALDAVKQPILPDHRMGWHTRKKSDHFTHYNRLAAEFSELLGVDPWITQIDTEAIDQVDFSVGLRTEAVAESAERILSRMKTAYASHGVAQEPFAFVKNNAGTYGMGIMVVHSASELREMNRRTKNKMSVGKNKQQIQSVVVQEGVPTTTLVDRLAAEPVIYLSGCELIGGFLRTNTERGAEENLNSQGMVFRKLCMADLRESAEEDSDIETPVLELVYGSIARISAIATGMEIYERINKKSI